ncbi:MAG: phosphotransferase [Actinomycetota bacterium]|nr:phosphotransferase [Actinomycetota bacterium]
MIEPIWDPEGVGPEWLTRVLDRDGALDGSRVTHVAGTAIGTGQVGCNVRYRLTYDRPGPGPESVVIKFASRSETSRATGVQTLTYETEVAFYQDLADTVDVDRPHCHYAAIEAGTPNVVLVLEDIDASPGDQIAGCRPDHVALAMDQAARLHGPRWGDRTLFDVPWLAAKAASPYDLGPVVAMLWPTFADRFQALLTEESLAVGEQLSRAKTWLAPEPGPATVCHSDFRLDNILFGEPSGRHPITVVDWQTVNLGCGTADVSYFLSAAVAPAERRRIEREMVGRYHRELGRYDIGDYDFDRCWDDYRRHSFAGFFMAVAASLMVERTERGERMFATMANGAAAQVVDLGATGFLR